MPCVRLSGGVPALAVGWSHKYDELLTDYDCPEGVLTVNDGPRLAEKLAPFVHSPQREEIVARLQSAGRRLRERVNDMWTEVDETLGIPVET